MHSHYAQEATSYANMQLSVHERISDLHRRAEGMAPAVAESAADSGCTDKAGTNRAAYKALGPRQRMAWAMVAEALGWNAISDKPAMLAAAEQCERDGKPYCVGYENTKPAQFSTALATETGIFEFGVWGPDQPLEMLPADDARKIAETGALIDELGAKYGLSTELPECEMPNEHSRRNCPCYGVPLEPSWEDALLAQPAPMHDVPDYVSTRVSARPAADALEPVKPRCRVCGAVAELDADVCADHAPELVDCEECGAPCDGTLTAHSELFGEDVPVCPNCHRMCTLTSASKMTVPGFLRGESTDGCVCRLGPDCPNPGQCGASAIAEDTEAEDAYAAAYRATDGFTRPAAGGRHAGHEWDIPSNYTGRHRCSMI
jgi:hypothetical protein